MSREVCKKWETCRAVTNKQIMHMHEYCVLATHHGCSGSWIRSSSRLLPAAACPAPRPVPSAPQTTTSRSHQRPRLHIPGQRQIIPLWPAARG